MKISMALTFLAVPACAFAQDGPLKKPALDKRQSEARLHTSLDAQTNAIDSSCDNIAKLHRAYAARGKLVVENPNAVYSEFAKP